MQEARDLNTAAILNAVSDGIFVTDAQTGLFIDVNAAGCKMFGYSRDELIGRAIEYLSTNVPPYTQQDAVKILQISKDAEVKPFEWHCRAKDGHLFWAEISLRSIVSPDNRMVGLAILRDITNRKIAEDALRKSRQIVEGILDAMPARIFWKDKNLVYRGCNAAFANDAGFANPEDVVGKDDYAMAWRDQAELYRSDDHLVVESGSPKLLIEEPQTTPDGKTLTLLTSKIPLRSSSGEIEGVLGVYMDITERKQAMLQLGFRDAVAHAISRSVAALLTSTSFAEGMANALQIVGEAFDVDRVLVLENTSADATVPTMTLCYAWQAPDIAVRVDASFFSRPETRSADVLEWYAPLAENKHVVTTTHSARGVVAEILDSLEIRSVLLMPINVDGKLWGNIGIDACKSERVWTQAEIDSLRTLAEVIGSSVVRERRTAELADANKIVDSSPTVLYRLKGVAGLPLIFVSGNVSWFGYSAHQLLSNPSLYMDIIHPEDLPKVRELMGAALANRPVTGSVEYRQRKTDGSYGWVESRFRPILRADGSLNEVEGILTDITERKRAEEQILGMARNDGLTGLANRRAFIETVQVAIARTRRGEKRFAVHYLDLDHFKDVNDTLGHPAGDKLLKATADRLRAGVRQTDLVSRFGGDEFAVLQTDLDEPADAGALATKLLSLVGEPLAIEGNDIQIGTSIGIAIFGVDDTDAESLMSHADVALYRAKADGRGAYKFFTEAMDIEVHQRVELANDLRNAIAQHELFLLYQPQLDIASGRVIGLEALVRWRHPRKGLLPPPDFIGAAEKTGLVGPLGAWVLREACAQTRKWLDDGVPVPKIAVNVSSIQFKVPAELERNIADTLDAVGLPAQMLEIELTETALMDTSREHNDILERLRARGVKLAIDDFGTGYSSLSYLRHFPVDLIKIAQDFVADVTVDANDAAIVKAAIGLANELNLHVIAEGVETAEQLALLRSWGCHAVQGYYFARPLPVEEVVSYLSQPQSRRAAG